MQKAFPDLLIHTHTNASPYATQSYMLMHINGMCAICLSCRHQDIMYSIVEQSESERILIFEHIPLYIAFSMAGYISRMNISAYVCLDVLGTHSHTSLEGNESFFSFCVTVCRSFFLSAVYIYMYMACGILPVGETLTLYAVLSSLECYMRDNRKCVFERFDYELVFFAPSPP